MVSLAAPEGEFSFTRTLGAERPWQLAALHDNAQSQRGRLSKNQSLISSSLLFLTSDRVQVIDAGLRNDVETGEPDHHINGSLTEVGIFKSKK